jgi:hypothetical protein
MVRIREGGHRGRRGPLEGLGLEVGSHVVVLSFAISCSRRGLSESSCRGRGLRPMPRGCRFGEPLPLSYVWGSLSPTLANKISVRLVVAELEGDRSLVRPSFK